MLRQRCGTLVFHGAEEGTVWRPAVFNFCRYSAMSLCAVGCMGTNRILSPLAMRHVAFYRLKYNKRKTPEAVS